MPEPDSVTPDHPADGSPVAISDVAATRTADPTAGALPGFAIIPTKVAPAKAGRTLLTRQRLIDWLRQQGGCQLILVSAEAGYGKSTLLTDHAIRSDRRCAWYRLETTDQDWMTFLSYLVAAFRELAPDFGASTEALLHNIASVGATRDIVLAQFLAELGSADLGPVDLILDDYHLVTTSNDVRVVLTRLLERAPEGLRVIIGGRGRPNLALGRMLAQDRIAELSIDDLRFTPDEIRELFDTAYRQPLGLDASDVVAERTEGWAASLQLVSASITTSRPNEVADFIAALDGAKGPIYDFLADEVLTRLSSETETVLVHASLLDRVRPRFVEAALAIGPELPRADAVGVGLKDAERLGLLSDRDAESGGRIHPLFRQFLGARLEEIASSDDILRMHHAIAVAAEPVEWLVAAKHYARAEEPEDAMRVLSAAAGQALGTGAWGAAVQVADDLDGAKPLPAVEIVRARAVLDEGRHAEAADRLNGIEFDALDSDEQSLLRLTRAAAAHAGGDAPGVRADIEEIVRAPEAPAPVRDVARAWLTMLDTNVGGSLGDAADLLSRVAVSQQALGLHYYAGVAFHNAAYAQLARAQYTSAASLAAKGIQELRMSDGGSAVVGSTEIIVATCLGESGDLSKGLASASSVAASPGAPADALADAAHLNAVCGDSLRAKFLLSTFDRGSARGSRELPSLAAANFARFALRLGEGDSDGARAAVRELEACVASEMDWRPRLALVRAIHAAAAGSDTARGLAEDAIRIAEEQQAWRWLARARILSASARGDRDELNLWLDEGVAESALSALELADVLVARADQLDPLPASIEASILARPTRWVKALRRAVRTGSAAAAEASAHLLVRFGTFEDASLLREFDQATATKGKRRSLANRLARRVSPTVRVHDLGPTTYEVGDRVATITGTRRRAATLLLYLVSRTEFAAPREQVMESLWPDQSPKSAVNSLHQTLFFLRRDLEPVAEHGTTADYIRMESDMVFLDPGLFQVDSVAFSRQAAEILASGSAAARGPEMLGLYRGGFAPEFEYEDWATEWRTHLHGTYLHLARATADALVSRGALGAAIAVLQRVVAKDPLAFDLRGTLVACLAAAGSADAAQAHYKSLAELHAQDLGIPADSYSAVIASIDA